MSFEPDVISKRIKRKEEIRKIFFMGIYVILIPIVLFSIFLTMVEVGKNTDVPDFLNYEFYTVISDSMNPKLKKDDIVIIKKNVNPDKIKVGNIITFKSSDGEIITHRVQEVASRGNQKVFVTKGDKNERVDSDVVLPNMLIGRVVYTLPSYLLVLKNRVFFSCAVAVLIAIILINAKLSKRTMLRKMDRQNYERGI